MPSETAMDRAERAAGSRDMVRQNSAVIVHSIAIQNGMNVTRPPVYRSPYNVEWLAEGKGIVAQRYLGCQVCHTYRTHVTTSAITAARLMLPTTATTPPLKPISFH